MPAVIQRSFDEAKSDWSAGHAEDQDRIAKKLTHEFKDFVPSQVTTPVCNRYLKLFKATPRTYNLHRTMLRQVLAFAAIEGLREGFNPVDNIPRIALVPRKRWVRDDEIKALKTAALQATRNGESLVQMIDAGALARAHPRAADARVPIAVTTLRLQDVADLVAALACRDGRAQGRAPLDQQPFLG
jgi:hypothetical protein